MTCDAFQRKELQQRFSPKMCFLFLLELSPDTRIFFRLRTTTLTGCDTNPTSPTTYTLLVLISQERNHNLVRLLRYKLSSSLNYYDESTLTTMS